MKSYENGIPIDGDTRFIAETVWGRVSRQNSLTYAFENSENARPMQDVGLDGLPNADEFTFPAYSEYLDKLRIKLCGTAVSEMQDNPFSPFNDPAGDNYHFFRSPYYDENRTGIIERYKHYNGVEGNSLSPDQSDNPYYQSSRSVPDVEDINQDNTLNEYERYYQYKVSIRSEDLQVGKNYISDRQESRVTTVDGPKTVVWYQFKIPLSSPDKVIGGINDFSSIRFARMFVTGFKGDHHICVSPHSSLYAVNGVAISSTSTTATTLRPRANLTRVDCEHRREFGAHPRQLCASSGREPHSGSRAVAGHPAQ